MITIANNIKNNNSYNVYIFKDNFNKVIYIGKTKRNINNRMQEHFSKYGHLPQECYNSVIKIKYYSFMTEKDMDIAEAYLIKEYKPKYNKRKEYIGYHEKTYIKKIIDSMTLKEYYGGDLKCQQINYLIKTEKRKTLILNQLYLKLKNILGNLK